MKNLTIGKKLGYIITFISLLALIVGYVVLHFQKVNLENEVYQKSASELRNMSTDNILAKFDVGISNAVSIASDGIIKKALKENNRDIAIQALKDLSATMKESTNFKNIRVQIHTKDNKSFVRAWMPEKFGDDLSGFRHSVVEVNATKKGLNSFEVGKAGLSIKSIMPIIDNNEHLGSLEFIQGLNSVAKAFDKKQRAFLLLMDKRLTDVKQFNSNGKTYKSNYIISQKFINEDFLEDAKNIDLDKLINDKMLIDKKYLYTYSEIKDFRGQKVGIALLASPMKIVRTAVEHSQVIINTALILIVLLIIFILVSVSLFASKIVISPLKNLNEAIKELITNSSENSSMRVKKNSNDELGEVVDSFNDYLKSIEDGIKQDEKVIDEAIDIVEKAKNGFYSYDIKEKANSSQVEELKIKVNEMLKVTKENMTLITDALIEFGNAKYDYKIDAKSSGNVGSLIKGTNSLGTSVSEILCMFENASKRLSRNAEDLAATSEQLSASSTQQAASLEETAAAVDEITSTISQTDEKTRQMLDIAEELKQTSKKDDELAHKTGQSMDDIDQATKDIVDAITIIDQIAFQTNILSLNAAVEAATAGEAGKGFAVVAGEVRNLAARSAEAAKEIKDLVGFAQEKTKSGKETADIMVESFNILNDKVQKVTNLISEVSTASNEQKQGMVQINDAINQLDKSTQENASASESVSEKAMALSELSAQLISIIERTSFDKSKSKSVCDINLVFDTTKLKLDHIKFKETNFDKVGNGDKWTVKNHHDCDLGKWIDNHKNETFASGKDWDDLLVAHEQVHKNVQLYIDVDSANKRDEKLIKIASDVEESTTNVFESIEKIKEKNCDNNKFQRGRDVIGSQTKDTIIYHDKINEYKREESTSYRTPSKSTYEKAKPEIKETLTTKQVSKPSIIKAQENENDDEWESF